MSDGITFRWVGVDKVNAKLSTLAIGTPKIAGGALYAEAQLLMTEIKSKDVPVANPAYYSSIGQHNITPGTLRSSGYVDPPAVRPPTGTVVIMGFGGAAAAYAHFIHEGVQVGGANAGKALVYHGQGGANYLLGPAEAHAEQFREAVKKAVIASTEHP